MDIRKASQADVPAVFALVMELAKNEDAVDKVTLTEQDLANYMFGEHACLYAMVAEEEEKICGIAVYYYRISTWAGKTLHLEDLVVSENYRGQGIGKLLFKSLANEAIATQAKRIDWEVSNDNHKGARFYKSLGAKFAEDWSICRMDEQAIIDLSQQ